MRHTTLTLFCAVLFVAACGAAAIGADLNVRALTRTQDVATATVADPTPLRWYQGESVTFDLYATSGGAALNLTNYNYLVAKWTVDDKPTGTNTWLYATGVVTKATGRCTFTVAPTMTSFTNGTYTSRVTLYQTDASGTTNQYLGVLHSAKAYVAYRDGAPTYQGPYFVPADFNTAALVTTNMIGSGLAMVDGMLVATGAPAAVVTFGSITEQPTDNTNLVNWGATLGEGFVTNAAFLSVSQEVTRIVSVALTNMPTYSDVGADESGSAAAASNAAFGQGWITSESDTLESVLLRNNVSTNTPIKVLSTPDADPLSGWLRIVQSGTAAYMQGSSLDPVVHAQNIGAGPSVRAIGDAGANIDLGYHDYAIFVAGGKVNLGSNVEGVATNSAGANAGATAYQKPAGGITSNDIAAATDSAYRSAGSGTLTNINVGGIVGTVVDGVASVAGVATNIAGANKGAVSISDTAGLVAVGAATMTLSTSVADSPGMTIRHVGNYSPYVLIDAQGVGEPNATFRTDIKTAAAQIGGFNFDGNNFANSNYRYAKFGASIESNATGAEYGYFSFSAAGNGSLSDTMRLYGGGGLFLAPKATTNFPSAKDGFAGIFAAQTPGSTNDVELWSIDDQGNVTLQTSHDGLVAVHRSWNQYTGEGRVIDLDALAEAVQQLTGRSDIVRKITVAPVDWDAEQDKRKADRDADVARWLADTNAVEAKGERPAEYTKRPKPQWLKDAEKAKGKAIQ